MRAADLAREQCNPLCLLADGDDSNACTCRCQGRYHGLFADASIDGRSHQDGRLYEYRTKHGHPRKEPLALYWEIGGDPLTDDYYVDEISAGELWRKWATNYYPDAKAEQTYGYGACDIDWSVVPAWEAAPFQAQGVPWGDFLTHYSWPRDAMTGERVQWSALPVVDKGWRTGCDWTKGGFFQEVTGWKPSPLQDYVNVDRLARAAGLWLPARAERKVSA